MSPCSATWNRRIEDMPMTQTMSPPRAAPTVEVTVAIRISADTEADVLATRLVEALESAVGATPDAWSFVPGIPARREPQPDPQPVLRLEVESRRALLRGVALELTRREFDLLLFLCSHPDRVYDRATLMAEVWGAPERGDDRTVDVHIRKIRHKLGPEEFPITTVRGIGYRFDGADQVRVARTGSH
jgi:two-component system phosphate regulon response regulator PhoB